MISRNDNKNVTDDSRGGCAVRAAAAGQNVLSGTKKEGQLAVERIYGSTFPVILGPMAGVTDLAFRLLCREQGCDVTVTEMISAKALYYGNKNTIPLLETDPGEAPVGVQIFGSEPELMGQMAHKIEDRGFAFVDINMGCPVPKIVNNHEGSALMKQPELAGRIVREVKKAVSLPVTVKFRLGFDADRGRVRSSGHRGSWEDEGAVLQRPGGLGGHPAGEGGSLPASDRQRRYLKR